MGQLEKVVRIHAALHYVGELASRHREYLKADSWMESGFPKLNEDWPQIEYSWKWCADHANMDQAAARMLSNLTCVGWEFFMARFPLSRQIIWLEQSLAAAEGCNIAQEQPALDREKSALFSYLATANFLNRNLDRALEVAEKGLAHAKTIGDRECLGAIYTTLGQIYLLQGNAREAVSILEKAIAIYTADENSRIGEIHNSLGLAFSKLKKYEKAVVQFDLALECCKTLHTGGLESITLTNKANALMALNQLEEAATCVDKALRVGREIGDNSSEGLAFFLKKIIDSQLHPQRPPTTDDFEQIAMVLKKSGNRLYYGHLLDTLKGLHTRAIAARKAEQASADLCELLHGLSRIHMELGELDEAITIDALLLEKAREINARTYELTACANLGKAYIDNRQYEEALTYLEDARRLIPLIESNPTDNEILHNHVVVRMNLGIVNRHLKDPRAAKTHYEKALAIAETLCDRKELEYQAKGNLGLIETDIGNFEEAIRYHEACLKYFTEIEDYVQMAVCQFNIAFVHGEKGDIPVAVSMAEQARTTLAQLNHPHLEIVEKQLALWKRK